MAFYGQTWFLSPVSGLIAVLIYYLCIGRKQALVNQNHHDPTDNSDEDQSIFNEQLNTYIGVFVVVCVLVYGSFAVADMAGTCRFIDVQPDIQTGGNPPF